MSHSLAEDDCVAKPSALSGGGRSHLPPPLLPDYALPEARADSKASVPSPSFWPLSSLLRASFLPSWLWPGFLAPSSRLLRRRASHLPHPFHMVDDVEELPFGDERTDDEAEADMELYNDAASAGLVKPLAPLVHLVQSSARTLSPLLPRVVHDVGAAAAEPLLRLLRASPPPPDSADSPSPDAPGVAEGERMVNAAAAAEAPLPLPGEVEPAHYVYPLQPAARLPRLPPKPLIPRMLIRIARWINPF